MKKLMRLAALLVAMLMLSAVILPALADALPERVTVTVSTGGNANLSLKGSIYNVYKLFSAVESEDGTSINYTRDADCVNIKEITDGTGNALLAAMAEYTEAEIRAFGDSVYKQLASNNGTKITTDSFSFSVKPGYYLVTVRAKNVGGVDDDKKGTVVSRAILVSATENVTVTLKVDAPSLDKQIMHNELGTWGHVGDNQIGDIVYYRTITTVPDTTGYKENSYKYIIHDTMDPGLTWTGAEQVKVYADADKKISLDGYYTVIQEKDHTFCVKVAIQKAQADKLIKAGDKLYTYYTAVLNEDALIYTEGHNDNEAYLEYSNNVYANGKGEDDDDEDETGETPHVRVYDWTFTYGIAKVDNKGKPLSGAKFVLSTNGKLNVTYDDAKGLSSTRDLIGFMADYTLAADKTPETYIIECDAVVLKGLDDAVTYFLYEVKEPEGYAKLEAPVAFTIEAEYDKDGTELAKDYPKDTVTGPVTKLDHDKKPIMDCDLYAGVVNVSGTLLPSTGGTGTTVYYVIGGVMVLAAVVLLVLRRRMHK